MSGNSSIVGVSDHGGWAILVTVTPDGTVLDRRRVELVDDALPAIPHHHEAQGLPIVKAVALIERVRASAERHAGLALDALAKEFPNIAGIALRSCPPLPPAIPERLNDYYARNNADWVMYREVLAAVATARGWAVHWVDAKKLDLGAKHLQLRSKVGAPWNNDHKLAMALAQAQPARR